MLTDNEIENLIKCPKTITKRDPAKGYKEECSNRRCDLTLMAGDDKEFVVFIRQNTNFLENFSIGLRYKTGDRNLGSITIVRYNGPHGETSKPRDGHYNHPHIHRTTANELQSGSSQPQEKHRKITDKYGTLEEALRVFCQDMNITNCSTYFPDLKRGERFNGQK